MKTSYFMKRLFCPSCKSKSSTELYSCRFVETPVKEYLDRCYKGRCRFEYLGDSRYSLTECNHCGLIYQEEIPNDFLMLELYDEFLTSASAPKKKSVQKCLYYAWEIFTLINHFKMISSQLKFLDFGMGWGDWCQVAKAFGIESYGLELSQKRCEYARSHGITIVCWEELPSHKFHFINTEQLFEHIAEPLDTMEYLRNSLAIKGLLKISVPDGRNIKKKLASVNKEALIDFYDSFNHIAPLEHINCFNYHTILTMADVAGFERVELPLRIQYPHSVYGTSLKQIAKNALRPIYHKYTKRTRMFFRQSIKET